ncbi:hypothetical protein J6590_057051 [Homalodisca vitripennis]|nr:hypothetical protein J6590_057051 [Homalodisca vitripennis]
MSTVFKTRLSRKNTQVITKHLCYVEGDSRRGAVPRGSKKQEQSCASHRAVSLARFANIRVLLSSSPHIPVGTQFLLGLAPTNVIFNYLVINKLPIKQNIIINIRLYLKALDIVVLEIKLSLSLSLSLFLHLSPTLPLPSRPLSPFYHPLPFLSLSLSISLVYIM